MRFLWLSCFALAAALVAAPAAARHSERPITNRNPDAVDVAKTPITDLNIGRNGEIPPILTAAVDQPYALDGLSKCRRLNIAVADLDKVLGPDIDLPQEQRDRISGGRVAQWVVTSFIPFRGLIREVSGANEQDRKVGAAIQAGLARRGFLKGVGAARGCKYPARPAPAALVQARYDEMKAKEEKRRNQKADEGNEDKAPPKSNLVYEAGTASRRQQPDKQ
ncbi:hypothetical protein [Novosphingobium sp.]|uniref:hypothetical protein n=1 Tax=Novosphingobium sp. TaxID=1874826 RepID=UPI002B4787ED|nr:hypothetical protein [Novosphingobium sp.]HKR92116.1 hypothetical protein [Novosphingobium sp.]